jgi:hypothetical protein
MPGTGRLSTAATIVFLFLLAGYGYVGYNLRQVYDGERALGDSLARSGAVWQAVRGQPLEDPAPLRLRIADAQASVTRWKALFPGDPETNDVLRSFLELAEAHGIQILKVDAKPVSQLKTQAGEYGVIRYSVQARGPWLKLASFFKKLGGQTAFAALGFENLSIVAGGVDGDDLSFDLVIYLRAA